MPTSRLSLALIALLLVGSLPLLAQQPTGNIVGTVSDPAGAVVPQAQVTLRAVQTGATRNSTTTQEGYYEFLLLRPGQYEVTVEVTGFRRMVLKDIEVKVGQVVRANISLELGDVTQVVEVTAGVPLIEPDKPSIGSSIDNQAIRSLPIQNRNFIGLALLTPGAIPQAEGTQGAGFSVSGMRSQSNNYTMDGISNNDPQINSPLTSFNMTGAVQEFNVQTSIVSTDVGRNSGAQINIVTKSGTNNFHGSAFYVVRNDVLDATPYFLNQAGEDKNILRRHQFGGSFGGPVIRNKTFFFFNFEGVRQKEGEPLTRRVPTEAERATVTDPISRRLLEFYALPNTPLVGGRNWAGAAETTNDNETYFFRVDHALTPKHSINWRYVVFVGETLNVQTDPFNGLISNTPAQHNALAQYTYAGARLVNEFRAGFSRNRTFFLPADVDLNPATIFTDANGNPLPGYIDTTVEPLNGGLPRVTISGGFAGLGAGTNMPQGRSTNTFEYQDNVTLTAPFGWSRHTYRFGAQIRRENAHRFLNGNYRGSLSFSSFANFAIGRVRTGTLRTGEGGTFRTWFRTSWSFYFQDTYKARPNLNLNYGLR
ncbi:MAG: carboxypeptidase regulatory-like domain-containing protein, partial [Candidatus Acidiferrales bacterium]